MIDFEYLMKALAQVAAVAGGNAGCSLYRTPAAGGADDWCCDVAAK